MSDSSHSPGKESSRRDFIRTSAILGGALAAPAIVPGNIFAGTNSDTLKIGLVGCGGRGTGAAGQALKADKNVVLTAMADIFEDRLKTSLSSLRADHGDKVKVDEDHCFVGFDAYQKLIDSGVDVVLLTTPPGFRPMQFKAAVAAGKHVFAEKPVAVDAPGVRSVLETVAESKRKGLGVLTGFCWRYDYAKRATFQQIHDGTIGDLRSIYTTYNTGSINKHDKWNKGNCKTEMEWMMRRWYFFTWLSGDHIVEQAVHSLDKMAWAMGDKAPLSAIGHGGRQVRTDPEYGHIYDHFAVVYDYPDGVKGFHFCRQQDFCAGGTIEHIAGTKGICHVQGNNHAITGEKNWRYTGPNNDKYQTEHDEFFASVRAGKPNNDGAQMAHSTMLAIMGRMAAYTGQNITWQEALNSKENLLPEKIGWDVVIPVPPVAMPGKTKFI